MHCDDMRGLFLISLVVGLGSLGFDSRANPITSIPTVNIDDTTGPITVTSSGFKSFSSGTIAGNSEAIWWCATGSNLGMGVSSGIWTEPGNSTVSDEFYVVSLGTAAYGFFLSDPAVVPTTFTITVKGVPVLIDLTKIGFTTSAETGLATQISPTPTLMSVMAASGVPDGGNTLILLGLGMGGLVWFGWRRTRSGPKR